MPFVVPTFNIHCNVAPSASSGWPPSPFPFVVRVASLRCALVYGKRVNVTSSGGTGSQGFPVLTMSLLLPPLSDVRGPQDSSGFTDVVEVPAGSGRYYGVAAVDDIGKGYSNEHRTASLYALPGTWLAPYP